LAEGYGPTAVQADGEAKTQGVPGERRASERQVNDAMTFTELVTYFRARFGVEDGQTMAEYGVVLAVITGLIVAALLALSGAIANALHTVQGYL
jgi:Flp pilus assembly pilin Flp